MFECFHAKGHVSFPGGHREILSDGSFEPAIDCAIRETYEELGPNIGNITIIGVCDEVPAKTGTMVTPVIGFIEEDVRDLEHFEPSVDEVERVFSRDLSYLLDPKNCQTEALSSPSGRAFNIPVFKDTVSPSGDERIWGLTAFILKTVLDQIIVPSKGIREGLDT